MDHAMVDMHQSQSQKTRYVLILQKALKDRSASALPTGSVQPMHGSCLIFGD